MQGQVLNVGSGTYTNSQKLKINYITVIGSADGFNAIVLDTAGNVIFQGQSSVTNERTIHAPLCGQEVNGIKFSTFTNINRVLIGVESITT